MDLIPDETCKFSENRYLTHCDHWYEDEGCCWCGTQEPNLVIIETEA